MEGCAMGQILHGSATTTAAVRRAIQHSQESLRALANRYGINQKTVRKWRNRSSVTDLPIGPKKPRSTVLSVEEEAVVVAFRRHTLLPLDDCLYMRCRRRECQESCVRGQFSHHALTNLSSNMMANWVLASHHSRGGIFHVCATWRKTRYSNLIAASSVGKCPVVRTARRSLAFKDSMAFVV